MLTASWFTYKNGLGRISISRSAPRSGLVPGFRRYPKLNPGPWFRSVNREQYIELYFTEILQHLDPHTVWDELHQLAATTTGPEPPPNDGDIEPVLLCFERPPFTDENWCHRRLVARWLEAELRLEIPELGVPRADMPDGFSDDELSGFVKGL